jgi:hypothetical protein
VNSLACPDGLTILRDRAVGHEPAVELVQHGKQLEGRERLGEVSVGPGGQAGLNVRLLGLGADQNDPRKRRILADRPQLQTGAIIWTSSRATSGLMLLHNLPGPITRYSVKAMVAAANRRRLGAASKTLSAHLMWARSSSPPPRLTAPFEVVSQSHFRRLRSLRLERQLGEEA